MRWLFPFGAVELTGGAVEVDAFAARWRLDTYRCAEVADRPPRGLLEVWSPDGKHAVILRGRRG